MKVYQNLFKAIAGNDGEISVSEDNERFVSSQTVICPIQSNKDDILNLVSLFPVRDRFTFSLVQADPVFQTDNIANDVDAIIETLNNDIYDDQEIEVKLQIEKTIDNSCFSVYDYQHYTEYLSSLSLRDFLNAFAFMLNQGYLNIEIYEDDLKEWSTETCLFKRYNSQSQASPLNADFRQKINQFRERLCHSEEVYGTLIPQDLIITHGEEASDELQKVFQRVSLMFLMIHLFDYSSLSTEDYRFKLCGYKTHAGIISTKSVKDIKYSLGDYADLYNIFKWCYEYGQRDEKISIARNVLTLNMTFENEPDGEFSLENDVYETIRSNYEFFERDHIRQYVELHAKLNETILNLEEKIIGCVNKYISEFKAGLFVIVSFLISSCVLRFINNAESFTPTILWISLVIILIYVISFLYTSWETSKAISNYSDSFDSLKRRYKDILSHKEQIELFGNENVYEHGKGIAFAKQRVKNYKRAWLATSVILGAGVIIGLLNC